MDNTIIGKISSENIKVIREIALDLDFLANGISDAFIKNKLKEYSNELILRTELVESFRFD